MSQTIFLVHGFRSDVSSMQFMARSLQKACHQVVTVDVGLTFNQLDQAVSTLLAAVRKHPSDSLSFVGHSTGGLVIRELIAQSSEIRELTESVVMVAVPNLGTPLADLHQNVLPDNFKSIHPVIKQLTSEQTQDFDYSSLSNMAVAGIAGTQSWTATNLAFDGTNDGVVSLRSACLPIMSDTALFPLDHLELMQHEWVVESVAHFLKYQKFPIGLYRMNSLSMVSKFQSVMENHALDVFLKAFKNKNVEAATFGGKVFWKTLVTVEGWQLQQHFATKHIRVLNPSGIRKAWGSEKHLQQCLDYTLSLIPQKNKTGSL